MKNVLKAFGIIVLLAVIGLSMIVCGGSDENDNNNNNNNNSGTAPTITTASLPNGTVGTAYSQTLTATGSTPITWSIDSGTLPAGLSIAGTTGVISGTPTTAAASTFTVKATNAKGNNTKQFSITIADDIPGIDTLTLSGQVYNVDWSGDVSFTESNASYSGLSDSLSNGSGNIQNGQLSYTLGKPDASKITYPVRQIFSQYNYSTITVSPSDAKCNITTINLNSGSYQLSRFSYTISTTGNEETEEDKYVAFFYVDKACTVNATERTYIDEDNITRTLPAINISMEKGWNILCSNSFEIYNKASNKYTKKGYTSFSVGDDSSLKWVIAK